MCKRVQEDKCKKGSARLAQAQQGKVKKFLEPESYYVRRGRRGKAIRRGKR
jgi:hypothetical protein